MPQELFRQVTSCVIYKHLRKNFRTFCTPFNLWGGLFVLRRISIFVSIISCLNASTIYIVYDQIAGTYPGITSEEFFSVTSDPPAELGQWTYDFSDSDGPQVGTVAIPGSNLVSSCEDPAVIIAEHNSLGVSLSEKIEDEVDLIELVDRAAQTFAERKFLVYDVPGEGLKIGAFATKADMPQGCKILGQVQLTMIPWLPSMKSTKTGFMEEDEYF